MASTKETEMDKHNENKANAPQQEITVLGLASVEVNSGQGSGKLPA